MMFALVVCALQSGFKSSMNFNLYIKSEKLGKLYKKDGCSKRFVIKMIPLFCRMTIKAYQIEKNLYGYSLTSFLFLNLITYKCNVLLEHPFDSKTLS